MLIKRVYNNNVVLVTDDSGAECVAVGRGLAFSRRAGDEVDQSMVEKVYTLDSEENRTRFENLIKSIPVEYLTVADEIVSMVQRESDLHVGDNLLIALADHISLSLERERAGVPCENPLLMEIKQFYKREFALARRAAGIIHERMGIWISEGETGFIALHIVNATMGQRADVLVLSIRMIQDILDIVSRDFSITYDEESIQYERFLRHLQFFAQRVLSEDSKQSEDTFLFNLGKDQYPAALACAEKIGAYVAGTYGRSVTDAEKGYLVYHIMNLVHATASGPSTGERSTE